MNGKWSYDSNIGEVIWSPLYTPNVVPSVNVTVEEVVNWVSGAGSASDDSILLAIDGLVKGKRNSGSNTDWEQTSFPSGAVDDFVELVRDSLIKEGWVHVGDDPCLYPKGHAKVVAERFRVGQTVRNRG